MSTSTIPHLTPQDLQERQKTFEQRAGIRQWNRIMRVVRRVHLYSGLFLFPWVMLYGVTALLFNHPGVAPDVPIEHLAAASNGSPLFGLPTARETAEQVVAELKKQQPERFQDLAITAGSEPAYPFGAQVNARGPGMEYNLSLQLTDGSAVLRTKPVATPSADRPFAPPVNVSIASPLVERVTEGTSQLLKDHGHEVDVVNFAGPPEIYFEVTSGGVTTPVKYNAVKGTLSAVSPLSWRGYFLRLHTAHHFPHAIGPRWFWALIVDVMFVAMVFWGISGLFMWWQIRSVRWVGLATVVSGAVLAVALGISMHGAMIN